MSWYGCVTYIYWTTNTYTLYTNYPGTQMEPYNPAQEIDDPIILSLVGARASRVLNRSLHKVAFREYVRELLEYDIMYPHNSKYSELERILPYLRNSRAAYWLVDAYEGDEYEGSYWTQIDTIGCASDKSAYVNRADDSPGWIMSDQSYEDSNIFSNVLSLSESPFSIDESHHIRLGYSTLYSMAIEDPAHKHLLEENEYVFKDELKKAIIDLATNDIHSSGDILDTYAWVCCNCLALDMDENLVDYTNYTDYGNIKPGSAIYDEIHERTEELGELLLEELERVL